MVVAVTLLPLTARAQTASADPLVAARELIISLEWDKAYKQFKAAAVGAQEGSDRWAEATFGMAVAISHGQPVAQSRETEAAGLYQQILDRAGDSRFAARSMMNLARLKELRDFGGDKPDLDAARTLYLKVAERWPTEPIAGEATVRAASTLIQVYDDQAGYARVKEAVALLEKWLADHPAEPLAGLMWQYLGDTYFFPLNEFGKSLAAYDKADAIGWVDKGNEGPMLWRAAVLSERLNNTPSAVRYYTKIIRETPNSGKAYESQQALKRLGAPVPEITIFRSKLAATTQPAGKQ